VTPLGLDQESYDVIVAEMLMRPAPRPLTGGRYYIAIEWKAEPSDDERYLILNTALWPHSDVKHLVYTEVEGSADAASPTKLRVPSSSEAWMAPLDETVSNRGGYLGPIRSSEPTWYEVWVTPGSSIGVRAFLNRPLGAANDGEFRVELHDASGNRISQDYLDYPRALDLDDAANLHSETDFGHPNGVAPRPLVGASTEDAEGPAVISFVWDAPPGEDGQVEFVVDIVAGDEGSTGGAVEESPTQEPAAAITDPAPVAEGPAEESTESDGPPIAVLLVVLVALVGGVVAYLLYRRHTNSTVNH
jgi:hypothetical protein